MSYQGEFRILGEGLAGWAKSSPEAEPLWVEAIADGLSLGCACCHLPEPDNCGFWLPLPPFVLAESARIQVRIANTEHYLTCMETVSSATEEPRLLIGDVYADRGLGISGWVANSQNPEEKLQVRVMSKGEEIAMGLAGLPHHLAEADGHAFKIYLPLSYADGQEHSLELIDQYDRSLPGSPLRICALPENAATWLEGIGKLTNAQKDMLSRLLRHLEGRAGGTAPFTAWSAWKEAFAPATMKEKKPLRLEIRMDGLKMAKAPRLDRQEGVKIQLAEGKEADFILFLQQGEGLHPLALAKMLEALKSSGASLAYADGEDLEGLPLCKPAWDRDAFLARDYLGPVLCKREVADAAGENPDYGTLRVNLLLTAEKMGGIVHVPYALALEKNIANKEARQKAIAAMSGLACSPILADNANAPLRISYSLKESPRISILIPTRDQAKILGRCLESLELTDWPDMELLILDNDSREAEALELMERHAQKPNVRIIRQPGVFNYAAMNNRGAEAARGELLCFLNNDTEIIDPQWLKEMARLLLAREDNGCVGAKLLWPNRLVQHGGVITGQSGLAAHVGNMWREDEPGYMWRNQFAQQYSAVTAACMLTSRKLFLDSGGFDARAFAVNFNDTDYCLRLRKMGKRVLWTPFARLLHHESASRGKDESRMRKAQTAREMRLFRQRWEKYQDMFYNPSLTLSAVGDAFEGLALPPAFRENRAGK